MLSRERPEASLNNPADDAPPAGLRFDEGDARGVVGQWRLVDEDGDRSCGIRLTDWPTGGGNAVVLGALGSKLEGVADNIGKALGGGEGGSNTLFGKVDKMDFRTAQFWSMDGNAVVLAAGNGRLVARFTRQSPGAWKGENTQGTASYTLTR